MPQLPKLVTPVRLRSPAPFFIGIKLLFFRRKRFMKAFSALFLSAALCVPVFFTGCATAQLPSEDIEIFTLHKDIIDVLKSDKYSADSLEKYEAAKKLIRVVDLYYTRELKTVNAIFNYRDMLVDDSKADSPVFSFNYRYGDHYVRIRFFSHKMFVTRVEITEK